MTIRILGSTSQDLIDGYWFYAKQAEGIGAFFLDSLYSDIDAFIASGSSHPVHFKKTHCMLSKRLSAAAAGIPQQELRLGEYQ